MTTKSFVVSADNRERLKQARIWIESLDPLSPRLVLAPSRGAADDFVRACSRKLGGMWGVHRMTLAQLASAFATDQLAALGRAPVSRLGVEALAARSVQLCLAQGALDYFRPVADMPGFSRALARTLLELRLDEAEGDALERSGPPGADLRTLLDAYQKELQERKLADLATLMRMAAHIVREGSEAFRVPTLLLDLSPVHACQTRLLAALLETAPRSFATVLQGDEDALSAVREHLGMTELEIDGASPGDQAETGLAAVRRWIFVPREIPQRPQDESVEFFSAPGEGRECVEIARRIRLAAQQGKRFDEMAVLLRDPETYLPLVEDALRRARIPVHFTHGTIRPDPAGRAFLALLACTMESLSASRFAEYLSLGQTPPTDERGRPPKRSLPWVRPQEKQLTFFTQLEELQTPGEASGLDQPASPIGAEDAAEEEAPQESHDSPVVAGTLQAPFGWERLLTDAAVIGGSSERWRRRLEGLKAELEKKAAALDAEDEHGGDRLRDETRRLDNLRRFALPLIDHLSSFPQEALWGDWLRLLRRLAMMALSRPQSVLALLAELEPMDQVGPVALREVELVLRERLTFLRVDPSRRRYGEVFVGTVDEAAGRTFDRVFLPGLAEGSFPRKAFEDPLLLDQYRRGVSSDLECQEERFARERLLLRIALGAARSKLTISYPRMDAVHGRPKVPSFYALDVLRAAEGLLPEIGELENRAAKAARSKLGWPAPLLPEEAIDDAEHDLSVLEDLLHEGDSARGRGRYLVQVNSHLARSLRTRWMRWSSRWSEGDGLVQPDEPTRALLQSQRLKQRSYSPTALQNWAACPYRFLLSALHGLRPRQESAPIEQLDPLTRGSLFHRVQFELFRQLQSEGSHPMKNMDRTALLDRLDSVLDRVAQLYREELMPAIPRIWRSEIEGIRSDLRGWIRHAVESDGEWRPEYFEFSFGLRDSPERHDPHSRREEARVLNGMRLRGSIDLVESNPRDGQLRVVDHKTGSVPHPAPRYVAGGLHLQPVLYGLAIEGLLKREVAASQLFYCTQRGGYRVVDIPIDDKARDSAKQVLSALDRDIERGFLPAAPLEGACDTCDFIAVCGPYEEQRVARKMRPQLHALAKVRELP